MFIDIVIVMIIIIIIIIIIVIIITTTNNNNNNRSSNNISMKGAPAPRRPCGGTAGTSSPEWQTMGE